MTINEAQQMLAIIEGFISLELEAAETNNNELCIMFLKIAA